MDYMDRIRLWLKAQQKSKLVFGGIILLGTLILALANPYDQDFYIEVGEEIAVARQICEKSRSLALSNEDIWNFRNNKLNNIEINGEIPVFKHIDYPIVDYRKNSYNLPGQQREIYCYIKDPRGGNESGYPAYYYDLRAGKWL